MWQHTVAHLDLGNTVLKSEEICEVASRRTSHIHTDVQQTFCQRELKGNAVLPPCATMFNCQNTHDSRHCNSLTVTHTHCNSVTVTHTHCNSVTVTHTHDSRHCNSYTKGATLMLIWIIQERLNLRNQNYLCVL
jgi:hypothetical protein